MSYIGGNVKFKACFFVLMALVLYIYCVVGWRALFKTSKTGFHVLGHERG